MVQKLYVIRNVNKVYDVCRGKVKKAKILPSLFFNHPLLGRPDWTLKSEIENVQCVRDLFRSYKKVVSCCTICRAGGGISQLEVKPSHSNGQFFYIHFKG